jgi:hypothetical protein
LHRLEKMRSQWSRLDAALYMKYALLPMLEDVDFIGTLVLDPKLVAGLVAMGIDPNISLEPHMTGWTCFLQQCIECSANWSLAQRADALDAVRTFLNHGARTDVHICGQRLSDVLTGLFGQDAMAGLEDLIAGGRVGYGTLFARMLAVPFRAFQPANS